MKLFGKLSIFKNLVPKHLTFQTMERKFSTSGGEIGGKLLFKSLPNRIFVLRKWMNFKNTIGKKKRKYFWIFLPSRWLQLDLMESNQLHTKGGLIQSQKKYHSTFHSFPSCIILVYFIPVDGNLWVMNIVL